MYLTVCNLIKKKQKTQTHRLTGPIIKAHINIISSKYTTACKRLALYRFTLVRANTQTHTPSHLFFSIAFQNKPFHPFSNCPIYLGLCWGQHQFRRLLCRLVQQKENVSGGTLSAQQKKKKEQICLLEKSFPHCFL